MVKDLPEVKIVTEKLSIWYGRQLSLSSISLAVWKNEILGIIGPANSGKTTFLQTFNRLIDLIPQARIEGKVLLDNEDIFNHDLDLERLRRRVGMVFALPTPLPLSIFENVAYGLRRKGIKKKTLLEEMVEESLKAAYLWDEVKDRLSQSALTLSGGQQQRLCIARTLALKPEVILFDEPCSGLDPISTAKIEEAMYKLKKNFTQILVSNNTKQVARVADRTAFFLMGKLIEVNKTRILFTVPKDKRTEDYISGRFG
ncbi:phosphate ABC transporter ATP-binding protein [bacterium]|nr:phosphate ABC transporter ATP-binding protein [bacterium]MBU1153392.1 phosphate ABC transporter ATP-binding protein [bacterium]MBU1782247.1 phosphate ABC transporter ATP-binding protein [bacterium]MBU2599346.1 phosphate ABC transporter ATP-binding protein [bacterium]